MKPALWIFLVISFAGMAQLTYGEESVSAFSNDDSTDDKPIAEMGTEMPDDDDDDDDHDLDDEAEEDEQKETSLFNELYKRGKKKVGKGEPGNKGKKGSKGKKEKSLWYDEVGCYNDAGPIAWQNTSLRALGKLYMNVRGNMNWTQEYAYYVAEECARAAQPYGCKCFGIQFYGECWCFEGGCKTFAKYGKSNNCREPLGKNWTNYVFTSKCGSKYGCCKDNSMPATGENYKGCPDCSTAVDLVIVVDSSGSIGKKNYKTMKEIVIKLIRHFSVKRSYARIGIVRYSSIADEIMSPQESQLSGFAALQVKINRMRYTGGGTSTGRALEKAYSMLMKSRRQLKKFRKIRYYDQSCIVISDGLTNASDKKRLERTSKQLKKIAKVIAVGVRGKNYSKAKRKQQEEELKMIATDKNKDFFIKDDFGKLKKAVDPIAKRACPLTYRKKGP